MYMKVGLSEELITWLLGFGPEVLVESPPALVERLRQATRSAAERYQ